MALNWNATQVAGLDWDTMADDVRQDISQFAFVLMGIGIPEVTETNYREVSVRIAFYEALNGSIAYSLDENGKEVPVYTTEFVKSMIGYHTNATRVPFGKWTKNLMDRHIKD
jgi:hypothetical protein